MSVRWGFLVFESYGHELPEGILAPVDDFMKLIGVRFNEPWPYNQTQFSAQYLGNGSQLVALKLYPGGSFPPDSPLLPLYLPALLGAISKQNNMHGLRELEAWVNYGLTDDGSYVQKEGLTSITHGPLSAPLFVTDEALLKESMMLEINDLGPNTYPTGEKDQVLQFLKATLDQLNSLPPQDPFIGKNAQDGPGRGRGFYSYQLTRQLEPRPWVHPHFLNSMAANVTATLITFLRGLEEPSYVHFKVLQVSDKWPSFVATGVLTISGSPVTGKSTSAGAADLA